MNETTVSVRINKELREKMRVHDEINWSAVLRRAITENLKNKETIDFGKMKNASEEIDKIRKSGIFGKGKEGTLIIREWRNKRK